MATWRDISRVIINRVIKENPGRGRKDLKFLISKKYPFGERQYHPYKIWLDEIKVQLKEKRFGKRKEVFNKDQQSLF